MRERVWGLNPTRSWGGAYGGFATCGTYSDLSCFACLVARLRSVKKTAIDRRKSQGLKIVHARTDPTSFGAFRAIWWQLPRGLQFH